MKRILGIVNLHNSPRIEGLNKNRSLASTSFLGRYNFIDFPLSNFSNSDIDKMGVLIKSNLRSLVRHIGLGHWWNDNTKIGKLSIMYNEKTEVEEYNHDINNLIENSWVYEDDQIDYVIFAPADILMKFDFNKLVDAHIKNKAAITLMTKKIEGGKDKYINKYEVEASEKGRVFSLKKNLGVDDKFELFTEVCIMDKQTMLNLINYSTKISAYFSLFDTINYLLEDLVVKTYEFEGDILAFDSLSSYLRNSLYLIDPANSAKFITPNWPIYTKTYDTPPALYKENAKVTHSVVANGAVIDGKVTNCVIGRNVIIEKGCEISNSVILSDTHIYPDCKIDHAVIDKTCTVLHVKYLVGTEERPVFIKKGDII